MENRTIQEQEQLQLEIQQHLQLKATAAAINSESPEYDPNIAQHAEELSRKLKTKWQMPLNLFICTLADPLLAKQMTCILEKNPMMTTAEAALRVHGLLTWGHPDMDVKGDDNNDGDREEKEKKEKRRESKDFLRHRRRLQQESDSLLDAVHILLRLHASHST